jgi:hypothetical protein
MALIGSKELLARAEAGERLSTEDRRHVVAWFQVTQPELNNTALAEKLGVAPTTIQLDKRKLREIMVDELREESEVKFIVADIMQDFRKVYRNVEQGLLASVPGTAEYLRYNQVLFDLRMKMAKSFQDLGWLPKGDQDTSKEEYTFEVSVGEDGRITSQKVKGKLTKKGTKGLAQQKEGEEINITPEQPAQLEANGDIEADNTEPSGTAWGAGSAGKCPGL